MTPGQRFLAVALIAASALGLFLPASSLAARDVSAELRRERGRLIEMKEREEKTASELTEALRKEKLSKGRVGELQERLKRQKRLLANIDRRISSLNTRLDRTEKAVRELEEAHEQARASLRKAASSAFAGERRRVAFPWDPSAAERDNHLMRIYLGSDAEDVARITRARDRKEEELSGIERQVAVTERKMAQERKVGETLLSRQEEERRRLADIGREKKSKEKELKSLRAKIARMEAVVSRVERQVREREERSRKRASRGEVGPPARGPAETPRRFASLPGGLSPPLPGKVVTRFGRQHDATFDVTIENRGVEIEAGSGAVVKSVGNGEVAFAGSVSGFGNVLIVQHGGGLFSVYGRMETFLAKQGEAVRKGAPVGRLPESPSGKSVLYLELRAGGTAIDPSSAMSLDR